MSEQVNSCYGVQVRHRDRQETLLVRADISTGANGVVVACLTHQDAGFAPYRLDNCTVQTLHIRCLLDWPGIGVELNALKTPRLGV